MAERIVNSGIKFAYANGNAQVELKKELEKYFLYQNILIVDRFYEFGKTIEILKTTTKCKFTIVKHIEECASLDDYACIVVVNNYDAENIKLVAFQNNLPYVFVLTKPVEISIFKNQTYTKNFDTANCNFPLGIVFCSEYIYSHKTFQCEMIMEISSISFNILQKKLGNLFFTETIEYKNFVDEKKILLQLQEMLAKRDVEDEKLSQNLAKLYLSLTILSAKDELNILDNLCFLYKSKSKNHNIIQIKYAYLLILSSLEKNYFTYYSKTFKDNIDIEKHISNLNSYGIEKTNFYQKVNQSKLNFLLDEFREKLLEYVATELKESHRLHWLPLPTRD